MISHHLVRNGLLKSKSSLRPKFQPGHLDKHYHWAHTLHRGGKFPKNADFAPDSGSLGVWNVCLDNDFFLRVWEVFVTGGVFMVSVQVWEVFMGNYFCSMGGFGWIWFVLKSM